MWIVELLVVLVFIFRSYVALFSGSNYKSPHACSVGFGC